MASSSPHPKKTNGESKKSKKTVSDSESDSEEFAKPPSVASPSPLEKSSTTLLKEIKATFDFKGPKDFQKIRILGKGGVGRVYLVQLKGTEKLFAMKVLKQEEMISRNKVKRVLTEREVLATTKHPLIISLYYSFQSRSRLYFVMDYCAGGEFYRTIQMQPHKCLTEDQMRFYAAEVLLALEYLHAMGFVYRDLKPENILLHASGHIRLTDFDLSKASVTPVNAHVVQSMMGGPTMVAEPTLVTNSFVGTEEYLAPEVIVGKGYGASVDWWTFGILMYEMLYGVTPFRGKSQPDTFHRIEKTQVKFPDHARAPVSKECKSLIKKLLTHDPKKRLGYEQGAAEIKAHPFFKDVNLQLILNSKPPIVPELSGPNDFKYFSTKIVDDDKDDEDMEFVNPEELDEDHPFKSFVPVDREMDSKAKAAAAAAKPFKKSSHHAAASPSSKSSKKGSSASLNVDASDATSRKKTHSRKNSGSETKSPSRLSSSNEDDGHHHHHHHHHHRDRDDDHGHGHRHHHHHHDVTSSSESISADKSSGGKHSSGSNSDDDAQDPQVRVPQPVRVKKSTHDPHALAQSAVVQKSRPRPPEEDGDAEDLAKLRASTTKVPRSRTPHPDDDTDVTSPKIKHSSKHVPTDDKDDDPAPTKMKKSTLSVKAEKESASPHSSHSRHSSSKRSHTPDSTTDGEDGGAESKSKQDRSESKSMKKVPSNLSDELDSVTITKSSSRSKVADEEASSTRSSRRGTPTTSKKQSSNAVPSD